MKTILVFLAFASSAVAANDDIFSRSLTDQVSAYLSGTIGRQVAAECEMLRDAPTVTGPAFPKFYVWVRGRGPDNSIITEGAMRIAEIEKNTFKVTDFVTKESILKEPEKLEMIFPRLLLPKIHNKADGK